MRRNVCGALMIGLCGATLALASAGPQASEPELQRRLEQGGKHWSAPKSARDVTYNVSGGDQLWLWPLEDAVQQVSRGNTRLTLGCHLRKPLGSDATAPPRDWNVRIFARHVSFAVATRVTVSGAIEGIREEATTCDVMLNEFAAGAAGEGWILLFVGDGAGRPVSNLLRLEINIVEGALDYKPESTPSADAAWMTQQFVGQSSGTTDVRFSPDGKLLAAAGADGRIAVWDVNTKQLRGRSSFKQSGKTSLAHSMDGALMLSWSPDDERLRVFEAATLRLRYEIVLPGGRQVLRAKFVPPGHVVAVLAAKIDRIDRYLRGLGAREITFWDPDNRKPVGFIDAQQQGAAVNDDLTFGSDGSEMASWFADRIQLWDVPMMKPVGPSFLPIRRPVMHVAFGEDGKTLNIVDYEKTMTVWDIETRTPLRTFNFSSQRDVASADFNRAIMAVSDGGRTVVLWDLTTGQISGEPLTDHPDYAAQVVFSDDGARLIAGSVRNLTVWDVGTRRVVGRCTFAGSILPKDRWAVDVTHDGSAVAIGRRDRNEVTLCVQGARDPIPIVRNESRHR